MKPYRLAPSGGGVIRTSDEAFVPSAPANSDWMEYVAWNAAGNVPDPVDSIYAAYDAQSIVDAANRATVKADATVALLASKTPAQIDAYVVANVTDLASAKQLLRALAQVCGVLAKEL